MQKCFKDLTQEDKAELWSVISSCQGSEEIIVWCSNPKGSIIEEVTPYHYKAKSRGLMHDYRAWETAIYSCKKPAEMRPLKGSQLPFCEVNLSCQRKGLWSQILGQQKIPAQPWMEGILRQHWKNWQDTKTEQWAFDVLLYDYCIPFYHPPPMTQEPVEFP